VIDYTKRLDRVYLAVFSFGFDDILDGQTGELNFLVGREGDEFKVHKSEKIVEVDLIYYHTCVSIYAELVVLKIFYGRNTD
jgi:hypothetical protein